MPIKRLQRVQGAFPQIGILRKGAPSVEKVAKDGKKYNSYGPDLEHFRFDSDDAEALERFTEVYGNEPRRINVFLPFATTDENLECWQEHWTAGALQHRCDGEFCTRWLTPKGVYSDEPVICPHAHLEKREKNRCKAVGRLRVVIPELRRLAYVMVLTTSEHDIITLEENLLALEQQRGSLRGIPMILSRSPREISTPGTDGKRVRREKWLLSIEAAPSWVDLQLSALEQQALPLPPYEPIHALPAPSGTMETENGHVVDMESGEVVGSVETEVQAPASRYEDRPQNGNGAAKGQAPVDKVQAYLDCAAAIGVEVGGDQGIGFMDDDELKSAGKKLRVAIVGHIQQLEAQLRELDPDCTLTHDGVLMKMKTADLQALGLRTIECITDFTDQPVLIEVGVDTRHQHDGEPPL